MDAQTTPPVVLEDERTEQVVVGAVVALALVVGLGLAAQTAGLLDGLFGKSPVGVMAPIAAVVRKEAGGDPPRVLLSGTVAEEASVKSLEADVKKAFPASEIRNALRADKRLKDKKREIVRISFAADAINEAWPRPRFGDVKRFELLVRDDKLMVRGAVFSATTKAAFEDAFAKVPKESQGVLQLREVVRSTVPVAKLQNDVSVAVAGRAIAFGKDVAIDAQDAAAAALLDAVAPLLKDLRGLEVLLSAGAADHATALKQAEAVKAALVARGADAAGLRAVPAAPNNPLSFLVREKE